MLLRTHRHRPEDLALWEELEKADLLWAQSAQFRTRLQEAEECLRDFVSKTDRGYAALSWGKDSTVLAHLVSRLAPTFPCIWVQVLPLANPDCVLVEQEFLRRFPLRYERICVWAQPRERGWAATGTLEAGCQEAIRRYGPHTLLGLRGEESGARRRLQRLWGTTTKYFAYPLMYWTHREVFAYLAAHEVPVHPAYAMLGGGRWARERLRVASLDGQRGREYGRLLWEQEYYGDVWRRLQV
jgi:phosphoadenosine phosphosulfate reductase